MPRDPLLGAGVVLLGQNVVDGHCKKLFGAESVARYCSIIYFQEAQCLNVVDPRWIGMALKQALVFLPALTQLALKLLASTALSGFPHRSFNSGRKPNQVALED